MWNETIFRMVHPMNSVSAGWQFQDEHRHWDGHSFQKVIVSQLDKEVLISANILPENEYDIASLCRYPHPMGISSDSLTPPVSGILPEHHCSFWDVPWPLEVHQLIRA